jgi:hypothetical protein
MTRRPTRTGDSKCTKVAYKTRGAAFAAALRASREIGPLRVYRCDRCDLYHLTSQTRNKR